MAPAICWARCRCPSANVPRRRRERRGEDGVLLDQVGGPLAAAGGATVDERMGDEHVDPVAGERCAQCPDQLVHPLRVRLGLFERGRRHQLLGADDATLRHERDEGDVDRRPVAGDEAVHAAVVRAAQLAGDRDAAAGEQRGEHAQRPGVVVVAGDDHDLGAPGGEAQQRVVHQALGLGRRRGGVEQVAGDDDEIHVVRGGDADDLVEHGAVLDGPAGAAQRLADVPVPGVQQAHHTSPSNGSSTAAPGIDPASAERVAHDGKGKSTSTGTGSRGWLTTSSPA